MLKAAVIGCGRMGAEPSSRLDGKAPAGWTPISHVEAFRQARGVELVALSDTDLDRLKWAGNCYQITRLYGDYRELLKQSAPDLLGIATRTPAKIEILTAAIQAGVKGVYVEKPLANSLADVRSILADADRAQVVFSYGVNRRYHPVYRQARDLIRAGEIGDLLEVVIEFGESQLLWTHPHSVDLMLFLSGQRPTHVQAECLASSVNRVTDLLIDSDPVVAHAHFWLDGGARGLILRAGGSGVRITGTRGTMEIASDGAALLLSKPTAAQPGYYLSQETIFPLTNRGATVVAIEELVANVRGQPTPSISPHEIETGMQMLLGCVYSHIQGGRRCPLAEVPEDLVVSGRCGDRFA